MNKFSVGEYVYFDFGEGKIIGVATSYGEIVYLVYKESSGKTFVGDWVREYKLSRIKFNNSVHRAFAEYYKENSHNQTEDDLEDI